MKTFSQFNEAFDKPLPVKRFDRGTRETLQFEIGNVKYAIVFAKVPGSEGSFDIEYGLDTYGNGFAVDIRPTDRNKDQFKIFATVIKAIKDKLDQPGVRAVNFTSSASASNAKQYLAMAKIFQKDPKYNIEISGYADYKLFAISKS